MYIINATYTATILNLTSFCFLEAIIVINSIYHLARPFSQTLILADGVFMTQTCQTFDIIMYFLFCEHTHLLVMYEIFGFTCYRYMLTQLSYLVGMFMIMHIGLENLHIQLVLIYKTSRKRVSCVWRRPGSLQNAVIYLIALWVSRYKVKFAHLSMYYPPYSYINLPNYQYNIPCIAI